MREKSKAYMAGIIDSEGCFYLGEWWSAKQERNYFDIYLDVTNKDRRLIQWIVQYFGGTTKKISRKLENGLAEYYYNWRIGNLPHLRKIVNLIQPYLFLKKPQALVIQEWLDMNGEENPNRRRDLVRRCQQLNQEGVTTDTLELKSKVLRPYLAGFLDGDGGASADPTAKRIYVCNTHRKILEAFQNQYGGTIHADKTIDGHKPSFHYQLYRKSGNLEKCILSLLPYSQIKRESLKALLDEIRHNKIQSELIGDNESDLTRTSESQTQL